MNDVTQIGPCNCTSTAIAETSTMLNAISTLLPVNPQTRTSQPSHEMVNRCLNSVHSSKSRPSPRIIANMPTPKPLPPPIAKEGGSELSEKMQGKEKEVEPLPSDPIRNTSSPNLAVEHVDQNILDPNVINFLSQLERREPAYISYRKLLSLGNAFRSKRRFGLSFNEYDNINEQDWKTIAERFPIITSIDLTACHRIVKAGLAPLSHLRALAELNLSDSSITNDGLAALGTLRSLRKLNLARCDKITYAGLTQLKGLENLAELDLNHCFGIDDFALVYLSYLRNLAKLNLARCHKITDAGLHNLRLLQNLDTLILDGVRITDAGLVHLNNLQNLQFLYLYRSEVTDDGIRRLKQKLPKLQIIQHPLG